MIADCSKLWPGAGKAVLHWPELVARAGYIKELKRPFLLAIRGIKPFFRESHPLLHVPEYDDTGVFLAEGKTPAVFPMGTHSYQRTSKNSPNGDTGSLRLGRYILQDLKNGDEILFHVKNPDGSSKVPVWRDTDNDGSVSAEEVRASEAARSGLQVNDKGMWADAVLLHGGLDSPPAARHRYSIACFTCSPMWRKLMSDSAKAYEGIIDMQVETAWNLLPFVDMLETPGAVRDTDPAPPPDFA